MFWEFPLRIQSYDSKKDEVSFKEFQTKKEFIEYVEGQFKLPGEYNIQNAKAFQKEGLRYAATVSKPNFEGGCYTKAVKGTHQWKTYWANEKDKVKNGIIVDDIYIPPFYYWYLNFCPIYDDVKKKKRLGDVWDGDLYFFLYIMLCLLKGKHAVVFKARQRGYSFKIMALLYWSYSWFEGSVNTIGAHLDDYVGKSWRFLEFYRKHINTYTAWRRGPVRPKAQEWYERTETRDGSYVGLDSKLAGTTFKISPENGVGGSQTIFFHEEAGIAPNIMKTVGFVRPAVEKGKTMTGLIILSGSVGELEDAEGLKEVFYHPKKHNFLPVKNVWDEENPTEECGLFVSEAYNLTGFIDANGNSLVKEAYEWIEEQFKESGKEGEMAQLDRSQKPTRPEVGFAHRKEYFFPVKHIQKRQDRIKLLIENKNFPEKKGILDTDKDGKPIFIPLSQIPEQDRPVEMVFPVNPELKDKRGVVTIWEDPPASPEYLLYFAGIDTIEVGVTSTSDSLFSIDIIKRIVEIHYEEEGVKKIRYEGGNVVANWTGRYDSVEETNLQGELLQKMYNAKAAVERNKPNYINYMRRKGLAEKYLFKKRDLPEFKDVDSTGERNDDFGVYFGADKAAEKIMNNNIKEYLLQELGHIYKNNSYEKDDVVKTIRGVDKINNYWTLEELKKWKEGLNTDRRNSLGLAIMAAKSHETTYMKKVYESKKTKEPPKPAPPRSLLPSRSTNQGKRHIKQRSLLRNY